ncbi:MAG: NADH-quinone oxidoreductase subunit N [Lacipirellulaceae bacterium]
MQLTFEQASAAVQAIAPEAILIATVCAMILLGPFVAAPGARGVRERWTVVSLLAFAAAWWVSLTQDSPGAGPFVADNLAEFVRMLTLALGPLLILMVTRHAPTADSAEAHACVLALLAGVNLVALSSNLVGLFLALELVSVPTYVLLYLPRRDAFMQEATIKYFLLSVVSSAVTLFGISWLYGAGGTADLAGIAARIAADDSGSVAKFATIGAAIAGVGLCFRLAAFPFHVYAPDVFQGVNGPSAAMLSVVPKIAGFVAMARLLPLAAGTSELSDFALPESLQSPLAMVAITTMCVGNFLALRQTHLHRLLAYSSIAQSGYMLVALVAGGHGPLLGGIGALWFYMAVYGVTTMGLFALLAAAGRERPIEQSSQLAGLSRTHPWIAVCLAICLFSLTGLPPTAGLTGKWQIFLAAFASESAWGRVLAATLAINTAVAACYYLRLVAIMVLDPAPTARPSRLRLAPAIGGALCAAAAVGVFFSPQWLLDLAQGL